MTVMRGGRRSYLGIEPFRREHSENGAKVNPFAVQQVEYGPGLLAINKEP
jgi:hypothetical protein